MDLNELQRLAEGATQHPSTRPRSVETPVVLSLCLSLAETQSLLDLVAWARYHSNNIYPGVASVDLFKAHLALSTALEELK